jgi:hypothetical protein
MESAGEAATDGGSGIETTLIFYSGCLMRFWVQTAIGNCKDLYMLLDLPFTYVMKRNVTFDLDDLMV